MSKSSCITVEDVRTAQVTTKAILIKTNQTASEKSKKKQIIVLRKRCNLNGSIINFV